VIEDETGQQRPLLADLGNVTDLRPDPDPDPDPDSPAGSGTDGSETSEHRPLLAKSGDVTDPGLEPGPDLCPGNVKLVRYLERLIFLLQGRKCTLHA
jgi:hypothetical protein